MSTIRVNAIQNTTTTDGGISIDSSGHVTVDGQKLPSAGPLSNRNLIDNGAMQVAQRGTTFTSVSNGSYTLDRWRFDENTSAVFDVAQSSTAPDGFSSSLKIDCTTTGTPTGQQEALIEQRIEAQNLQHLQYGASGAQSTTLSFWVRSNKTGDYGLWLYLSDTGVQYATTYTISSADTWEYKTITIPGNTANAINNDIGIGLIVRFYLQIGPTNAGTPTETWTSTLTNRSPSTNLGDSTDNEWLLSGVQLEVGEVATPFEHRNYSDELEKCKRYFQNVGNVCYGIVEGTTLFRVQAPLYPVMRTNPSVTVRSGKKFNVRYAGGDTTITDPSLQDTTTDAQSIWVGVQSTGLTNGSPIFGRSQQDDVGNFLAATSDL